MGTQMLERWLRDAAPLVPYDGEWWVHADPKLFPISNRQFWRQLGSLTGTWRRRRTKVGGLPATLMAPMYGTNGLNLEFRKCHLAFQECALKCIDDLEREEKALEGASGQNGTYALIVTNNNEINNKDKILNTHSASLRSAVCVEKIQKIKKTFRGKEFKTEGQKKMKTVEVVAKHKAKSINVKSEQRDELIQTAHTQKKLEMLWRILYSEQFGYASSWSAKERACAVRWNLEFHEVFEGAPIGLMWSDFFRCWDQVRKHVSKAGGWKLDDAPEKPVFSWLYYNRAHVADWWVSTQGDDADPHHGIGGKVL